MNTFIESNKGKHFTLSDRISIEAGIEKGWSFKKIADERSANKEAIIEEKAKRQAELNKYLHGVEELYRKKKVVSISAPETTFTFDAVALIAIEMDDFKTITALEERYPEFREYIYKEYRSYKTSYPKEKNKLNKYKRRFQRLLWVTILLILAIIVLSTIL